MSGPIPRVMAGAIVVLLIVAGIGWKRSSDESSARSRAAEEHSTELIAVQVKLRRAQADLAHVNAQYKSASEAVADLDAKVTVNEGEDIDRRRELDAYEAKLDDRAGKLDLQQYALDTATVDLDNQKKGIELRQAEQDARQAELDARQKQLDEYQKQLEQSAAALQP